MEDTCRKETCWFYMLIKDLQGKEPDVKDCPFYNEMIWTPQGMGEKVESAKVIQDCVNKRSLSVLLEFIYPRLLGVQQSNEQQRNVSAPMVDLARVVLERMANPDLMYQEALNKARRTIKEIDD